MKEFKIVTRFSMEAQNVASLSTKLESLEKLIKKISSGDFELNAFLPSDHIRTDKDGFPVEFTTLDKVAAFNEEKSELEELVPTRDVPEETSKKKSRRGKGVPKPSGKRKTREHTTRQTKALYTMSCSRCSYTVDFRRKPKASCINPRKCPTCKAGTLALEE